MRPVLLSLFAAGTLLLSACAPEPTPVAEPVKQLNVERYMGTWYEIARLPHSFQEGLQQVTAEYRLNRDGSFEVTNRGYNDAEGEWETAIGLAEPIDGMEAGFTIQFQWPFKGGYYVAELGDNYDYAVVVSNDKEFFWLLARDPGMPRWLIDQNLAQAAQWGIDVEQIIETEHP
jgi:apolipoprotein D and lipocalin family protein